MDTQLLGKRDPLAEGGAEVVIKTESLQEIKIEFDEATPRPRSTSEIS